MIWEWCFAKYKIVITKGFKIKTCIFKAGSKMCIYECTFVAILNDVVLLLEIQIFIIGIKSY